MLSFAPVVRISHCPVPTSPDVLTPRQRDIARLLATGLTYGEVATRLSLDRGYVRARAVKACERLGLRGDRALLMVWYREHGASDDTAADCA